MNIYSEHGRFVSANTISMAGESGTVFTQAQWSYSLNEQNEHLLVVKVVWASRLDLLEGHERTKTARIPVRKFLVSPHVYVQQLHDEIDSDILPLMRDRQHTNLKQEAA